MVIFRFTGIWMTSSIYELRKQDILQFCPASFATWSEHNSCAGSLRDVNNLFVFQNNRTVHNNKKIFTIYLRRMCKLSCQNLKNLFQWLFVDDMLQYWKCAQIDMLKIGKTNGRDFLLKINNCTDISHLGDFEKITAMF